LRWRPGHRLVVGHRQPPGIGGDDSWNDNSETIPAGEVNFYHEYLLEAATTGITVMFSSGRCR